MTQLDEHDARTCAGCLVLQVVTERDEARANRDRLAHELAAARAELAQLRASSAELHAGQSQEESRLRQQLGKAQGALAAINSLCADWDALTRGESPTSAAIRAAIRSSRLATAAEVPRP